MNERQWGGVAAETSGRRKRLLHLAEGVHRSGQCGMQRADGRGTALLSLLLLLDLATARLLVVLFGGVASSSAPIAAVLMERRLEIKFI